MIDCGVDSSDFGSTKVSAEIAVPAVQGVVAELSSFQVCPETCITAAGYGELATGSFGAVKYIRSS